MSDYLCFDKKTTDDFSDENINAIYNQGYVFTRLGKGMMSQTRSLRIDLSKFGLSSENKRVMRKNEDIIMSTEDIPMHDYNWSIGKLGKDFYQIKFEKGIFSANKIKELLTNKEKSNFNKVFAFKTKGGEYIGYCIARETNLLIHYSYPFYSLKPEYQNIGMGMMLCAIIYTKQAGKKYIYLGSAKDAKAKYKLQFAGLEWFDKKDWQTDLEKLKNILT